MEEMNRTILKSGLPAFVDANQIEETIPWCFDILEMSILRLQYFDSNDKENALCCEMKAAFISEHKAFCLPLESNIVT